MEPTGLSFDNVSTPRETIVMLKAVIAHPVLGPITQRGEYEAHPVGKPPIKYVNTDRQAARSNVQLLGGKTGYNDIARYCLVVGTKIDGRVLLHVVPGQRGEADPLRRRRARRRLGRQPQAEDGDRGRDAGARGAAAPVVAP